VSSYLDLAKRVPTKISPETSREELASRRRRKLEEAGRRGLVVRWSEYPDWIALHDPLSGEWVEVRSGDCFPLAGRGGEPKAQEEMRVTKKTKETKKGGAEWKSRPESGASPPRCVMPSPSPRFRNCHGLGEARPGRTLLHEEPLGGGRDGTRVHRRGRRR
jgi:hypothetical protein